ncbi:hypothetical protein [Streptomyces sp. NBC_00338]|uniref:hypothetical protein n=1 Tax=Streptomyces sp. NBC_00338 TaxID=2975715 RepID=UPI002250B8A8|nr:hypothetical protein [Streptomyces sp. NBC_00338]MCX5138345.1 hypothetical protein [Streptomyces sp. NBC_00338]MCX5145134.1 hypothetical protein [Streptomyces sp. NBC_00338]
MIDRHNPDQPLLLIDVDGPLNPYAAKAHRRPEGYTTHRMRPTGWEQPYQKPLRVWLNHGHGEQLTALPYTLIWATTWAHEANEWIGPHLGLPELPVITWPERPAAGPYWKSEPRVFWKTATIVEYAAGRPFAWIDDDITDLDREYVAAHHDGPALLHHIDPRLGLLPADFDALDAWATALGTTEEPAR